jgi:hypothetical protein
VATDLVGRIEVAAPSKPARITFGLAVHQRPVLWIVLLNLAAAIVGPWSTELFIEIYSWYWQPPLCILAALWIWWRWPRQALADAQSIAPHWIGEIRSRVTAEPASTSAPA